MPLLAQADCLTQAELSAAKSRISQAIRDQHIACFSFTSDLEDATPEVYAVSSATKPDHDMIDASLLMDSKFLPPLVATELSDLVTKLLSADGSSWLRYSTASKATRWMRERRTLNTSSFSALTHRQPLRTDSIQPIYFLSGPVGMHRWHGIERGSWAQELRRSLAIERFNLSQEKLLSNSFIDMAMMKRARFQTSPKTWRRPVHSTCDSHQDPLGLLELLLQLRKGSRLTVEFLSSFGILGCMVVWIVRPQLLLEWGLKLPSFIW